MSTKKRELKKYTSSSSSSDESDHASESSSSSSSKSEADNSPEDVEPLEELEDGVYSKVRKGDTIFEIGDFISCWSEDTNYIAEIRGFYKKHDSILRSIYNIKVNWFYTRNDLVGEFKNKNITFIKTEIFFSTDHDDEIPIESIEKKETVHFILSKKLVPTRLRKDHFYCRYLYDQSDEYFPFYKISLKPDPAKFVDATFLAESQARFAKVAIAQGDCNDWKWTPPLKSQVRYANVESLLELAKTKKEVIETLKRERIFNDYSGKRKKRKFR